MSHRRCFRLPSTSTNRAHRLLPLLLALALALSFGTGAAEAQVDVSPSPASYSTLGAAFAAINAGTHTGAITIGISGDTAEGATVAILNASGVGAASYTSIVISPTGGVARTISGATTAGSPMIDLNGADNVTIDGLNTGGNSLTIANTTVSATSGTATIRFIGGATNNVITNSNIQGSATHSVATNGATIFFSTDAVSGNGNDNNTISNNNIGPAGANLPTKGILCNGSTTTTAIGNSGNIVDNNNVFDYFGAATTSAGIATNGGCNTWTITNNRLYQTATRTWTTGALHSGINIQNTTATSGAQGFTITGNTVGFASNTQTGTYTLTGAVTGARFAGILYNGINAGPLSTISNNTVSAVGMTGVTASGTGTSSPFVGILLQTGLVTSNGNTIGSQSATGSLNFSTTTTATTDVYGLYNFSSANWIASNNNIGGMSVTNLGASGTFNLQGIRGDTVTAATQTLSGNNVGGTVANSMQLTSTGTGSQVIGMLLLNGASTWTSNTVRNLTNNNGTGTGTGASVIGMSSTNTAANQNFSLNTISALSNTHVSAATSVTGIQFNGFTANVVEKNRIFGLTVATTSAAAEVNGIRVAGGTTAFRNNMIAVGAGVANAIGTGSTTGGINGIFETGGTNNFFHNSVYVGGAPTAGVGPSYGFASTQVTVARSNRDNVYFNARSNAGATGKNYAIRVAGTAPNPAGLTLNNNVYHANGAGAVFGFFNSLDVTDLAAWKVAVGQDAGSIDGNPQYNDPTNASPDLHIHPTNATVVEGNGQDVGVTDDFDGQTRSGLTPVDIGADAGNFNGIDLAAPAITYAPLANTTLFTDRVLSANLTDVTGVATGGLAPRIYYRKNAGSYFSQACSLTSGSVNNGTWNCTIVNADMGGVVVTDTISYFVIAQDAVGNIGSNPPGATATDVNNVTVPPATPNSYLIALPISGVKTVCASGCDYTTLTGATGAFNTINSNVLTGNTELQIAGDLIVGEDGSRALNALAEEPAGSNFTLKIYPTGSARAITGAFNGALIRLNGANRVTIDGSIGGVGTDRSLTLSNTSVTTPTVVLFGSVGSTPITNGALRNCVVINGANTASAVVISDAAVVGAAGFFSGITVQNNEIQRAFVGVFAQGGTTPQGGSNLVYTQNTITTAGANAVRIVGLYMQGVNGATVTDNTVSNISNTNNEDKFGIWLASGTINATVSNNNVSTIGYTGTGAFGAGGINVTPGVAASNNVIAGNSISAISSNGGSTGSLARGIVVSGASADVTIERNNVQGIVNTSTGTFPAYGIDISGGNNVTIRNNFVSNVSFNMTGGAAFSTQFGIFGIRVGAGTGHRVYNNSVNLYGALPGTAASSLLTAAFGLVSTASTGVDVRDNVFANNITGGTTSIAHVSAYLPAAGTSAMNLTWNNNAYFFGTDAARQGVGQAGTTAGTNFFTTLPALLAYSSTLSPAGTNDNASQASTGAVPFATNNDLHITSASTLIGAGVPLAGVTVDFDGDPRPATIPDIGADEVVAGILSLSSATYSGGESSGTVTITVNRTGGSAGAVSVDYGLPGGTANGSSSCTAGIDYINTPGTLNFADTVTSQTFDVTLCPDALNEANETVNVNLGNPGGGAVLGTPIAAVLTINDDDPAPTISVSDVTQNELNSGTSSFTFQVTLSAASGQTVTVHAQTADGSATVANNDYVAVPDTLLTFNPGDTSINFPVTVNGDTAPETNENFFVDLSTPANASILDNQGTGTITNDDTLTGPVTVTATAGTVGPTDYPTLNAAFDAINLGTHQGVITVDVVTSVVDTAVAVLNSSGAGAASYTSVLVRPSNDAVSVSFASATGRGVIELNGADNVTIDGDNPNSGGTNRDLTIQNTAVNTTTFTSVVRVALSTLVTSANNVIVRNANILGSATGRNVAGVTSTTGSENTTYGILVGGGASTVAATTPPSAIASVTTTIGGAITATGFTADNNSINAVARGIAVQGSAVTVAPNLTVTNNVIGAATGGAATTVYSRGMTLQGFDPANISGNTVRNVESFLGTSIASISLGDVSASGTNATVTRNRVEGLFARSTTTFGAWGINVNVGNAITVANNFISNLRHDMTGGAAFSTQFGVFGIRLQTGNNHRIYYNSVNLFGAYPGTPNTSLLSAALEVVSNTQTGIDIRNNSLSNTISGGTTSIAHVAIYLPSGGTSAMNLTLNNNGYYHGLDASRQGVGQAGTTAGTNFFTTLAQLQAYSSTLSPGGTNDNASFASTAPAPYTSSADLHIPPATVTRLESGGAVVTVTTDIDGDPRSVTTPDIGADEFAGLVPAANDIAATAVVTPPNGALLLNGTTTTPQARFRNDGTATQTSVNVQFAITGPGGFSYLDSQSIATIAPGQSVVVTFAATSAFTTPGSYSSTATVTTADAVPANDTATAGFSVSNPLTGTYSVGTAGDFTSLTNAGGVFAAINSLGASGPVVIDIVSDLAGETGAVPLNEIAGSFPVTIKPSGAPRLVSGSSAVSIIKLSGTDNVTIDGSLSGGTDRSLTITNSAIGPLVWIATNATSGANANTVKNLNLTGPGAFTGQGIIAGSGATFGAAAEFPNSGNTIQNNAIKAVQNAAFIVGNAAFDQNWVITGNTFGSTVVTEKLNFRGMLIQNAANFTISNNVIAGVNSSAATTSTMSGIQLAGLLNGGSITGNRISDIRHNNAASATSGSNGIFSTATSAAANVLIANNFISDIASPGNAGMALTNNGYGIAISSGGGYTIVHNSVLMNTNQGANAATGNSAAVNLAAGLPAGAVNLRDNVLANTQTLGTRFAVISSSAATVFSAIDFNDYFAQNVGFLGGAQTTLANWQTATGQDASSLDVDPLFVAMPAPADLHLQATSPMQNVGTPIAGVTVDIDGNPRSATAPEIGADEIADADLSITKSDGVGTVAPGSNTTYTIVASNAGPLPVTGATVADTIPAFLTCSWTCVGAGGGTCTAGPVAGNINDTTVGLPAGGSVTYTLACTVSGAATGSIANTATVSSATADPNVTNNSATDTNTVGVVSADLSITKTDGATTEIPGTTVSYTIVAANAGPSPVPSATVADTFPASLTGCSTVCVAAGGASCTAGPVAGNINDTAVVLPAGGSVTYSSTCTISASATGSLVNTATVTSAVTDPDPANNAATDTDTLVPTADVAILKSDGTDSEVAGTSVVYSIVVTNAGPSDAPNVTVADSFVAELTGCSTTCVAGGGASCTAGPVAGNVNDTVNLPVGGSASYTATCTIAATAEGSIVNTATATVNGGVTDPTSGNNSSTDTDLLDRLFLDGFESGDTSEWSDVEPLAEFELFARIALAAGDAEAMFAYDLGSIRTNRALAPTAIAELASASGDVVARLVARRVEAGSPIELRLEVVNGARSGWVVADAAATAVRIDWSTANAASLGAIGTALDGVLTLWVEGFDPAGAPARLDLFRERVTP